MKKYPWDQEKEIDWDAEWRGIAEQFADRYYVANTNLITHYFRAKRLKTLSVAGWTISAILFFCLVVISQ